MKSNNFQSEIALAIGNKYERIDISNDDFQINSKQFLMNH